MTDIAHEAGLVAASVIESPVGIADIVTMTTHKTLRAARGAIILAQEEIIKKVNRALLPGLQGGPFNNNIAGIAVGLNEALQPEFHKYAEQVIQNRAALEKAFIENGFTLVAGGGDKHLLLIDLRPLGLDGKTAAEKLAEAGIITNMNSIPWDNAPPTRPSGLRVGTPLLTTQGADANDMREIAGMFAEVLKNVSETAGAAEEVRTKVGNLMQRLRERRGAAFEVAA
jgi:glycine hydroxymethyltransferase